MILLSKVRLAVTVPILVIAVDLVRRLLQSKQERKMVPLPPGPPRIPFLGNAHTVNTQEPWKTYTDWHAKYGDMLYLRLLDQDVVVLSSQKIAVELLEKRSQVYSGRPFIATLLPFGGDKNFAFFPYSDHWRLCRRIFHQTFRSDAALSFRPMQLRRARRLVINIAEDPTRYASHYSTFAVAVALLAAYGYEPRPNHDPIVDIIEEYTAVTVAAVTPEKSVLLRLLPFLLHIPDWFPGSSLKREAKYACNLSRKVVETPYQYARERMKTSHEFPMFSMVSDHLSRMEGNGGAHQADSEYIPALKQAAVTSVHASLETTSASLMTFTLAMVLHPYTWKRAQAEIDMVIGTDRLPEFSDRPALPYVEAIVRETLRWHPVLPLGIWHATSNSDVYNGYYIPNGATVVANVWAMSRDEARFPNPEAFNPERYLDDDGLLNDNDPSDFVFGFGRRICPGRHTADASLWCAIATMLATLDFFPLRDDQGRALDFEQKWLNGLSHHPDIFPCQISFREHVNKSYLERVLVTT